MDYEARAQYPNQTGLTKTYAVPFPYLLKSHLWVYLREPGGAFADADLQVVSADYIYTTSGQVRFLVEPSGGKTVEIRRVTPETDLLLSAPTVITVEGLNQVSTRLLYISQEKLDAAKDVIATAIENISVEAGPPGPALTVGAWSSFGTVDIPIGTDTVLIADTLRAGSTSGTASFIAKLDPEQTEFTAQMTTLMNASGNPLASAQAAMRTAQALWRKQSKNGRWFVMADPFPWTGQFGCPGDATFDNGTVTGTDVFFQLQTALDYCLYISKRPLRIGQGGHRCSRGLQHGYGRSQVGGWVSGFAPSFAANVGLGGALIVYDNDLDPGVNVAGAHNAEWSGVAFADRYSKFLYDTSLGVPANPMVTGYDIYKPQDWHDPSMRSSQNGRYNPSALFVLGAFDGPRPLSSPFPASTTVTKLAVHYCNGNEYLVEVAGTTASGSGPAGTGDSRGLITSGSVVYRYLGAHDAADLGKYTAYREPYRAPWLVSTTASAYGNDSYGTGFTLRDCVLQGRRTLFACKPCNDGNQEDNLNILRTTFSLGGYCVSVSNHQQRSFRMAGCFLGLYEVGITNNTHGQQTGSLNGAHIDTCGFGEGVDIFRFDASYAGNVKFTSCYSEAQGRLGSFLGGGFANMAPEFDSCKWILTGVHPSRGQHPRHVYDYPDGNVSINEAQAPNSFKGMKFTNCIITVDSVFTCYIAGAEFDNTIVYALERGAQTVQPYQAHFGNLLAGGLVLKGLRYLNSADIHLLHAPHNLTTGVPLSGQVRTGRGYRYADRDTGIPAMVVSVCPSGALNSEELVVPHTDPYSLGKSTIFAAGGGTGYVAFDQTDPTDLHIYFPGLTQLLGDLSHFGNGSAIVDSLGTIWAVHSFDAGTDHIYGTAQNNRRVVSGVSSFLNPVSLTVGEFALLGLSARMSTPSLPLAMTFTGASTALTLPVTIGGGAVDPTTLTTAGDYLFAEQSFAPAWDPAVKLSGRTSTTGTLSIAATASGVKRLPFLVRPQAANV